LQLHEWWSSEAQDPLSCHNKKQSRPQLQPKWRIVLSLLHVQCSSACLLHISKEECMAASDAARIGAGASLPVFADAHPTHAAFSELRLIAPSSSLVISSRSILRFSGTFEYLQQGRLNCWY
jgi:hypothetical protein